MKITTIQIKPETRDRLKALGKKGQSYDQLINDLIDGANDVLPKK